MVQRVMSVDSASVFLLKSNPPYVGVTAHGKVPTTGWTHPNLGAWVYVMPPSDGIQDFDFYAEPPGGITLPVVSPIAAHAVITRNPNDYWGKGQPLVGVRVHARENSIVAKLDQKTTLEVDISRGLMPQSAPYPWPWPWSTNHIAAGSLPLPWPFPWSVARPAGPEPWPWPWLSSLFGGSDSPFPLSRGVEFPFPFDPCKDVLIGKDLRVYHTGDALTKDLRPDRANIELAPSTNRIVNIWFG
jgi:hypothetical protein